MSFVTCPLDIIRAILEHCDRPTLTSLALVCHSLAVEVPVFLYRELDVIGHHSDGSTVSLSPGNTIVVLMSPQTYWELLRRLALMDPPILARHVRILKFGHAYDGMLRAAVRRMTHLRHVEYHYDMSSNEETALGVIKGADLRYFEWRWGFNQDLVLAHVGTHYPNLIELSLQWHLPRGADNYNDPPVLPARFPALQSLRAEWAVAFLFLHQHGHVLVHLDITHVRQQSPCPSWTEQPLPSLRYLRIRGSHTLLGSDLRQRIAASAPNLEVIVMAIDDCNVRNFLHYFISICLSVTVCTTAQALSSASIYRRLVQGPI